MRFGSRRAGAVMLVAGVMLTAAPVTVWAQSGDTSTPGFYAVSATSTGIGISEGDPSSQPYPLAAGLVPNAVAELGIGPSGHALASVAWPGPAAGNAGSLANVIGTPLPPDVVANANDPVKAEAQAGGGSRDAQTLGPMSAVVDGPTSVATTALSDFASPGLVSSARIVTTSRTYIDNGAPTAIAETQLQGIDIAGGVLHIDSLVTTAKGTTDGNTASTQKSIVVSGVTVSGQAASIDDSGIHLAGQSQPNPLLPVVDAAGPALSGLNMTAYLTKPMDEHTAGGAGTVNSGALIVDWNFFGSGQHIVLVLGGAGVNVSATPGGDFAGLDTLAIPSAPSSPTPLSPSFDTAPILPSVAAAPAQHLVAAPKPRVAAAAPKKPTTPILAAPAAATYPDTVPLGWMVIGALGMVLAGLGLHQLRGRALGMAAIATTCPLERGTP